VSSDAPGQVVGLWRHPIKGIGREALQAVDLAAEQPLKADRAWALLHARAPDVDHWQHRRNFLVVANGPKLAQVTAATERDGRITLTHPELSSLTCDPGIDGQALLDWVKPLWPDHLAAPKRVVSAPPQGMADNGVAQVSILNMASLRALSQRLGQPLQIERFRGNVVLDGLGPWQEFEWLGRAVQIGAATVEVTDRISRCRATEANPTTGRRDAETLAALHRGWGHVDFGVYATVRTGGRVAVHDAAAAL